MGKYSLALKWVQEGTRFVPITPDTNQGRNNFLVQCKKLHLIVQLFMGELPAKINHEPYLTLTRSILFGDMTLFEQVMDQHKSTFQYDHTLALCLKLKPSVRKSSIKRVMQVYSAISLKDMAQMVQNGLLYSFSDRAGVGVHGRKVH